MIVPRAVSTGVGLQSERALCRYRSVESAAVGGERGWWCRRCGWGRSAGFGMDGEDGEDDNKREDADVEGGVLELAWTRR